MPSPWPRWTFIVLCQPGRLSVYGNTSSCHRTHEPLMNIHQPQQARLSHQLVLIRAVYTTITHTNHGTTSHFPIEPIGRAACSSTDRSRPFITKNGKKDDWYCFFWTCSWSLSVISQTFGPRPLNSTRRHEPFLNLT